MSWFSDFFPQLLQKHLNDFKDLWYSHYPRKKFKESCEQVNKLDYLIKSVYSHQSYATDKHAFNEINEIMKTI